MAEMTPADVPHEVLMAALAVISEVGRETGWGTNGKKVTAEEEQRRVLAAVLPLYEQQLCERVLAELHVGVEWGVEYLLTSKTHATDTEAEARDLVARYRRDFPSHPHRIVTRPVGEWRGLDTNPSTERGS